VSRHAGNKKPFVRLPKLDNLVTGYRSTENETKFSKKPLPVTGNDSLRSRPVDGNGTKTIVDTAVTAVRLTSPGTVFRGSLLPRRSGYRPEYGRAEYFVFEPYDTRTLRSTEQGTTRDKFARVHPERESSAPERLTNNGRRASPASIFSALLLSGQTIGEVGRSRHARIHRVGCRPGRYYAEYSNVPKPEYQPKCVYIYVWKTRETFKIGYR